MGSMDWQKQVGYQRVIRSGPHVWVSGTIGIQEDGRLAGEAYAQARRALERIAADLKTVGCGPKEVVRTRIFVTDMDRWPEVARAHREMFAAHPPVSTLVEVHGLILDEALVEIEADAYIAPGEAGPAAGHQMH